MRKIVVLYLILSLLICCALSVNVGAVNYTSSNQLTTEKSISNEEIMPLAAKPCNTQYVEGIGWVGSASWRSCVNTVAMGGTIPSFNGVIVSEQTAKMLILEAGGWYLRTEDAHGGLNPHNYRHVNYRINGTDHNTIRIHD